MVEASNAIEAKIAKSLRVGETIIIKTENIGIVSASAVKRISSYTI